jgi:bifunctional non-homologous end joining protein LigD
VKVVLHGTQVEGRYVFFHTRGKDWMVHRMDPPPDPDWEPVPVKVRPMLPTAGPLPGGRSWAYELAWGGIRALVPVSGGRARIVDARGNDVSVAYPELRPLGQALGSRAVLLDGEIVALGKDGRPDPRQLRRRPAKATAPQARTLREAAVTYLAFDLLHLDGHPTTELPYEERRALLEEVGVAGPRWSVAPRLDSGADAVRASRDLGLAGVVAKRLASPYGGGRSEDWRLVDSRREQEVAIGGWVADGNDEPRALLVGTPADGGLTYVATVRSGLSGDRAELARRLGRLSRKTSPFVDDVPTRSSVRWVRPSVTAVITTTGTPRWSRFT